MLTLAAPGNCVAGSSLCLSVKGYVRKDCLSHATRDAVTEVLLQSELGSRIGDRVCNQQCDGSGHRWRPQYKHPGCQEYQQVGAWKLIELPVGDEDRKAEFTFRYASSSSAAAVFCEGTWLSALVTSAE